MAIKKIKTTYASGAALECTVVRDADGYLLDNSDGVFKVSATPGTDFRVPLTESASVSGLYLRDESRTVWNNGTYTIVIYLVGGFDPAGGDEMSILADAEVTAQSILTQLTATYGSGDRAVDHNTGADGSVSADYLRYVTDAGAGIDNGEIRAYLKTDYDAGNLGEAYVKAASRTGADGRWQWPLHLDSGLVYMIVFYKQGQYSASAVQISL